ncbi:response regulator [Candidatus Sumerlaeota bacterium]|nr:response regulator [Candidatus Sumerlaeota bacterium]
MAENQKSILLIDRDPEERTKLSRILAQQYRVDVATSASEGLNMLSREPYALILIDFETVGLQIDLFVNLMRERIKGTKIALLTKLHLEEYIFYIRNWGITNVMPKRDPYNPDEVLVIVENFIHPEKAFGLRRYLPTLIKTEEIRTRDDKSYVVSKIINFFGANGFSSVELYDVRLVLEEIINNAIYHAFRDEQGHPKYRPHTFVELAENEIIKVDYGCLGKRAGFAVNDNQGALECKQIIDALCRQYDKEGLYDQSGRGLFLSRRFTNTLIINIRNRKLTQIIALLLKNSDKDKSEIKPFYINYVE